MLQDAALISFPVGEHFSASVWDPVATQNFDEFA